MNLIVTLLVILAIVVVGAIVWSFIGTLVASGVFRVTGHQVDWNESGDDKVAIISLIVLWPLVITVGVAAYLFYIATREFYKWCMKFIKTVSSGPTPDYGE